MNSVSEKYNGKKTHGSDSHTAVSGPSEELSKNTEGPVLSCFNQPGSLCSLSALWVTPLRTTGLRYFKGTVRRDDVTQRVPSGLK